MDPDSMSVRPSTFFSSDLDETWYVGGGRLVMYDGKFLPTVKVKVKVTEELVWAKFVKYGPHQIDTLRQGQRKRMEVSIP